ncbi:MAG: hypothetical protein AABY07_01880 [Nanoarchaeota archaeon]
MKIKKCPRCMSTKIDSLSVVITGQYFCKKCSYLGPLIIEKEVKNS